MKTSYLIVLMVVLLQSCKENTKTAHLTDPVQKESKNTCLLDYQTKLDNLLTTDLVLSSTNFSSDVLEVEYINTLKNPEHHTLTYAFNNGRKQEFERFGLRAVNDLVELKYIKPFTEKQFESSYRALTDEQIELMSKKLNDAIDGKSEHKNVQDAVDKLNTDKETAKQTTKNLTSTFAKVSQGYKNVDDLGDAARWNIVSNELVVLKNNTQFVLKVDIGDVNKNKTIALNIAKQILNTCQ